MLVNVRDKLEGFDTLQSPCCVYQSISSPVRWWPCLATLQASTVQPETLVLSEHLVSACVIGRELIDECVWALIAAKQRMHCIAVLESNMTAVDTSDSLGGQCSKHPTKAFTNTVEPHNKQTTHPQQLPFLIDWPELLRRQQQSFILSSHKSLHHKSSAGAQTSHRWALHVASRRCFCSAAHVAAGKLYKLSECALHLQA